MSHFRKLFLKLLGAIFIFLIVFKISLEIFFEPFIKNSIHKLVNEKAHAYKFEMEKLNVFPFRLRIELENIIISEKRTNDTIQVEGKISSVELRHFKLLKLLFKKDIQIRQLYFRNISLNGDFPFKSEKRTSVVSRNNIAINEIFIENIHLDIRNTVNPQSLAISEGYLKAHNLRLAKNDTVTLAIIGDMDFNSREIKAVTSDSNYTFKADSVQYNSDADLLEIGHIQLIPNFDDYTFVNRFEYQIDCFDADLSHLSVHDFYIMDLIHHGTIKSSLVEIEKAGLTAFRDKRKPFHHKEKVPFQDMIYHYPGSFHIDSLILRQGDISYVEHAEEANEAGFITFKKIHARIYSISNDIKYKDTVQWIKLNAEALLMGKGMIRLQLKAKLFDNDNRFYITGSMDEFEIKELNPMLEKSEFVYISSGKLENMKFDFTADNDKAEGKVIMLYKDMELTLKNKETNDTTAIKERLKSMLVNFKILNSNPMPGEEARIGKIEYERDPERFLFNYTFKSVFSGIKTSLTKSNPKSRQ